jgi:hypothetical protein
LLPIVKVEHDTYRIILPRRHASELLLAPNGFRFDLPEATVPRQQRVAKNLTLEFTRRWGLQAYCLFTPSLAAHENGNGRVFYQVMDLPSSSGQEPHPGVCWIPTASLTKDSIANTEDFYAITQCLRELDAYDRGLKPGPFGRAGWLNEFFDWVQHQITPLGLQLSGTFHQFNACPTFSLIRLETNGPALWFKAVGKPNLHEYSITLGLAQDHPRYFPTIIATKPEWNGWLMLEAEREHLDDTRELGKWQRVAEIFAHLQLECLGKTQRLLDIGCKDRRIASITEQIDPFFETMDKLMQEQPSEPPLRLSRIDLQKLRIKVKDACDRLQQSGIPDSLLHGDFNLGNIRMTTEDCVFLDWAEGYVGPTFLTLEYLIAHLHRTNGPLIGSEQQLRRAYARCWSTVASEKQVSEAMTVMPSIAVIWYAVGCDAWRDTTLLQENWVAQYLRSLTRRMHRELETLTSGELCLE